MDEMNVNTSVNEEVRGNKFGVATPRIINTMLRIDLLPLFLIFVWYI